MIAQGIRLEWLIGTEYIPISLMTLSHSTSVKHTYEAWKADGVVQRYNVTSVIKPVDQGRFRLIITYDDSANLQLARLPNSESLWGTSTIDLDATSQHGYAKWVGKYTDEYDGQTTWERIDSGLTESKRRKYVSQLQRQQQLLRAALIATDGACALTGEECSDVLDAAHIIPAYRGGREVIENALLLRADLHRLFDAGHFSFDGKGRVRANQTLPLNYHPVLRGRTLPSHVFERICRALEEAHRTACP